MDNSPSPRIVREAKGVALGVQNAYADALNGVPVPVMRPAPSIGYKCPVYAPGMEPKPMKMEPSPK